MRNLNDARLIRLFVRVYGIALWGLPTSVRRTIGIEMTHSFRMACRTAYQRSQVPGAIRVLLLAMIDLLRWIPREWRDRSGGGSTTGSRGRQPVRKQNRARGFTGTLLLELRQAVRTLIRHWRYAALAVTTLAVGLGVNTTVFSLVYGVLYDTLDIPEVDRVITVAETNVNIDIQPRWASIPNYLDWQTQATSFETLGAFRGRSMSVTGGERPQYVYGSFVTREFFEAMAVLPLLGRVIAEDESTNSAPVVVLGYDLWRTTTGADSGIVGQSISVDGIARTVVGVMPPGFDSPGPWIAPGLRVGLWIPFGSLDDRRVNRSYHVVGRLADGVRLEDARSEIELIQRRLATEYPGPNADWETVLFPWHDLVVGSARTMLYLVWGTAAFVLLIACVNVAGLILNRTIERRPEFALRTALGAGRARLIAQMLVEAGTLSVVGGLAGLGLAYGGLQVIRSINPGSIPLLDRIGLHPVVIFVTGGMTIGAAFVVTLIPLVRIARGSQHLTEVAAGDRRSTRTVGVLKHGLAVTQLAITFTLLIGTGLLARTLINLRAADLGIQADEVYQVSVALSWDRVSEQEQRTQFVAGVLERLRSIPGVESAAMINSLPFSGSNAWQPVWLEGEPIGPSEDQPVVSHRGISMDYFATMGIPLLQGREFQAADLETGRVVIVNRELAQQFWPDADPIGERIIVRNGTDTLTVVGLVGSVRHFGVRGDVPPELYHTYATDGLTSKSFVVKTSAGLDPSTLGSQVRNVIFEQDPDQPVRDASTMRAVVNGTMAAERFSASMLVLGSAVAVVLGLVGVFGVMANLVIERRKELAVRLALGATSRELFSEVLLRGLRLGVAGCITGLLASLLMSRFMQDVLFGISHRDLTTYLTVFATVVGVSLVAGLAPALRATQVPLVSTLTGE